MDQVKQYLAVARKHHFWILCGLAAFAALLVWYLSTNKLAAEFQQGKSKVQSAEQQVNGIQLPHPNDSWIDQKNAETERLSGQITEVWNALYNQQKQAIFDQWPKSLSQEFMGEVARIQANPQAEFSRAMRIQYQNLIRHEIARLAQIVDADPEEATSGGMGTTRTTPSRTRVTDDGTGTTPVIEHRVQWKQLADIHSSFDWDVAPSTQLIKMAQEELWVYEALCNVIAKVNEGSTGPHNAPIKEIADMAIAYATFLGSGSSRGRSWAGAAPAGGGEMEGRMSMMQGGGMGGGTGVAPDPRNRGKRNPTGRDSEFRGPAQPTDPAAVPGTENPDEIWKNYRYVTPSNNPIMGTELETRSPPEYNLMPFRLKLVIEPRFIDRLLVAFRNSVLPLEVREVRINPDTTDSSSGPSRSSAGRRLNEGTGAAATPQDHTVNLEIAGVVYLIKKPDPAKVGVAFQDDAAAAAPAGAPVE